MLVSASPELSCGGQCCPKSCHTSSSAPYRGAGHASSSGPQHWCRLSPPLPCAAQHHSSPVPGGCSSPLWLRCSIQIVPMSEVVPRLPDQSLTFFSSALNIPKSPFPPGLLISYVPSPPCAGKPKGKAESSSLLLFSAVKVTEKATEAASLWPFHSQSSTREAGHVRVSMGSRAAGGGSRSLCVNASARVWDL